MAELAEAQDGLVSRGQLLGLGLGRRGVQYRLQTGRLRRVRRGVYAVGHRPSGRRARWWAALLAVGDDAVLSHRSAAVVWGMVRAEGMRIDVSVPRALRPEAGIALHRTTLPPDEVADRDGLRVTSPPRTLLDLAAVLDRPRLRRAAEQAEANRLADRLSLDALLKRHPGRPGTAALRAMVAEGIAPTTTRSELEERCLAFLDAHALPRPHVNALVEGFEVDVHWPDVRLILELDGHAFHAAQHAFERDRRRDRTLQAAGWRVVRVTWRQLHGEPEALAADLRRLLASV